MTKRLISIIPCLIFLISFGQEKVRYQSKYGLEHLINNYIATYNLSQANLLRLSAYAELKGFYASSTQSLELDFGKLGNITFYADNCLLKTPGGKVFYLNKGKNKRSQQETFEQEVNNIFERISLLSNQNADPRFVAFIDRHLARKNIEPFEKVYTRHILLKYGKYQPKARAVEFRTEWLPKDQFHASGSEEEALIRQHNTPLKLVLDSTNLRGYYIQTGGYVYVENVKRKVAYASGEQYSYNVSAFKLFVQKLFVQTTQYVVQQAAAERRQTPLVSAQQKKGKLKKLLHTTINEHPQSNSSKTSSDGMVAKSYNNNDSPLENLYGKYTWIPTMMGRLKAHNIEITDPDILHFLIDQPYFPRIYQFLSKAEKAKVDRYKEKYRKVIPVDNGKA